MRLPKLHPLIVDAVRFVSFGALMTPVSFGVYMALIHVADIGVMTSSLLRAVIMTPFIFYVSRYLTWRKYRNEQHFLRQLWRYVAGRPVTLVLHQVILLGSVAIGVHYAAAYWLAVSLTGIFNFFYQRWFAFGKKPASAQDA